MQMVIGKMYFGGNYTVIYDDKQKYNPYRVYRNWYEVGEDGRPHQRRKQVNRFADMTSCMALLKEIAQKHDQEGEKQ